MLIRTPATGIREDQDPRWSPQVSEETGQHHQADYFSFTLLVLNLRFGSEAGWKGEKRKEEECLKFCFLWCKPQTSQRFLIPHQRLNGSRRSSKLRLQFSRTWKRSRTIRVEIGEGEHRRLVITVPQRSLQRVTDLFSSFFWGADTDWAQMWAESHLKATTSGAQSWNDLVGEKKGNIRRV